MLFRILTSLIFLYAGMGHVFQANKILGKFSKSQFYSFIPNGHITLMLIYISGIVMLITGTMLAAGWYQKMAATILLVVLFLITISAQLDNLKDLGPFFKNVAIAGSLLLIINYKQNENKNIGIIHSNASH